MDGKVLIPIDDSTMVDPELIAALTCDVYSDGPITRIYLDGSNEPIRVAMALKDVLAKVNEGHELVRQSVQQSALPYGTTAKFTGTAAGGGVTVSNREVGELLKKRFKNLGES